MVVTFDRMLNVVFDYNVPAGVFPTLSEYGHGLNVVMKKAMGPYCVDLSDNSGSEGFVYAVDINESTCESVIRAVYVAHYNDGVVAGLVPFIHNIVTVNHGKGVIDFDEIQDGLIGDTAWSFGKAACSRAPGNYYYIDAVVPLVDVKKFRTRTKANADAALKLLYSFFGNCSEKSVRKMLRRHSKVMTLRYENYRCSCFREISTVEMDDPDCKRFFKSNGGELSSYMHTYKEVKSVWDDSKKNGTYVNKVGIFERLQYGLNVPDYDKERFSQVVPLTMFI